MFLLFYISCIEFGIFMKNIIISLFVAAASLLCASGFAHEREHVKPILVFDFGGVIAEADHEVLYVYMEQALHLSRSDVLQVIGQLRESRTRGVPEDQFWKEYAISANIILPENWLESLDAVKQSAVRPNQRMIEEVKKLKALGYRIALLSNVQKPQAKIVRDKGLYLYFEPIVLSCEIGVEKPNVDAYQILLQRLHAKANECIMIDDSPENIQAAQRIGMGVILFQSVESFQAELKRRNIPEQPRSGMQIGVSLLR
jgi:HAD superfamily hydrolase (TIGR01509 family)